MFNVTFGDSVKSARILYIFQSLLNNRYGSPLVWFLAFSWLSYATKYLICSFGMHLTLPVCPLSFPWCLLPFGGFIKGILREVRCTKSVRVLFLHRRPPSRTTLVLYSRVVFIFNEPAFFMNLSPCHINCGEPSLTVGEKIKKVCFPLHCGVTLSLYLAQPIGRYCLNTVENFISCFSACF